MKKKIVFLLTAVILLLTACGKTSNNTVSDDSTAAENDSEATAQSASAKATLSEEEAFRIEESAAQSRGAKEKELYGTLEDAEINLENAKQLNGEELQKADFTDCSIAVFDGWNVKIYEWMSEKQTESFIDCITKADISSEEYGELPMFAGGNPGFKIVLNTGEVIIVNYLDFQDIHLLIINNHGYVCNEEVLTQLNEWYQGAVERFHEKAWQS